MNLARRSMLLGLGLLTGVLVSVAGCASTEEAKEGYVDPNTGLVAPYRPKGDGSGVTGWDQRAREIERSLGS